MTWLKAADPDDGAAQMESGKVALGGLVIAGGDAAPCLQFVDQTLDRVAVAVQLHVAGDRPSAPAALLLPVRSLVLLLRDDGLDPASAQVGTVGAGGVGLVAGDRVGAGAWTANWSRYPDLVQYGYELRAVCRLSGSEDEGQGSTASLGGDVDLAGLVS
ncbi:RagB/SusD domain protein [Streptomyces malaysiensis subsp. malaysiensis]|nr:RagB/SusD domain protein [Streptomyces malaysiensis]